MASSGEQQQHAAAQGSSAHGSTKKSSLHTSAPVSSARTPHAAMAHAPDLASPLPRLGGNVLCSAGMLQNAKCQGGRPWGDGMPAAVKRMRPLRILRVYTLPLQGDRHLQPRRRPT